MLPFRSIIATAPSAIAAILATTNASAGFRTLTADVEIHVGGSGDLYSILNVYAGFDSPLDELLGLYGVRIELCGGQFNHNDVTNFGVDSPVGTWDPNSFFPPLFANPAVDSFLTIGGTTGSVVFASNTTLIVPDPVATPASQFEGDWFNASTTNMQGLADQINPNGPSCLHHVWIGQFVVKNPTGSERLVIGDGDIGWTCPNCPALIARLPSQAWDFSSNPPPPAAPTGSPVQRAFRVQGIANNCDWSWEIAGSAMTPIVQPYVKGVNPGDLGFGNVLDVTHRFADSINALANAACFPPGSLSAMASPTLLPPSAGTALCGVNGPDAALLVIEVGDPNWTLGVGPPAGCALLSCGFPPCVVDPCNISACMFNPGIVEVPLSGTDCNGNGEDDVLDLLTGVSVDGDGDGVPDECGACPPSDHACVEQGGPGCTDIACCALVCATDAFCCEKAWDDLCVGQAIETCGLKPACPRSDHDCQTAGGPGCTDGECCVDVCGFDPFCCSVAWDHVCVRAAGSACALPEDLDGNGAVDGGDIGLLLGSWGASGPADLDGNGIVDGGDLGQLLGAWTG